MRIAADNPQTHNNSINLYQFAYHTRRIYSTYLTAIKLRKKLPLLLERVRVRRIKNKEKSLSTPTTMPFLYWKTPNPPKTLEYLPHFYLAQSRSEKAGYS